MKSISDQVLKIVWRIRLRDNINEIIHENAGRSSTVYKRDMFLILGLQMNLKVNRDPK